MTDTQETVTLSLNRWYAIQSDLARADANKKPPPETQYPPAFSDTWRMEKVTTMSKLMMRMQWGAFGQGISDDTSSNYYSLPFSFIALHEQGDEVFVFIVQRSGSHVTLTDQARMFPSDALVTQLRIMEANAPPPQQR